MPCNHCPRNCSVDRKIQVGFCNAPYETVVSKSMLHFGEEPVISGTKGSGAIFFSGCNLLCSFCQNRAISKQIRGEKHDINSLTSLFFSLEDKGAHNINLVTPTPYLHVIVPSLENFKKSSTLPVVYNCGGYENVDALKKLDGLVDVYLPDFKYKSSNLSSSLSCAVNYFTDAVDAISEMVRQQPKTIINNDLIEKGVIIRHLVLPSHTDDSIEIVKTIKERFPSALLSLMSQYTPEFYTGEDKTLKRKLTSFEYKKVLSEVERLGIDGFCQNRTSATSEMTPDF